MSLVLKMCIAGEWIEERDRGIDVINPATEEKLGVLPVATRADLTRAVEAADRAFGEWSARSVKERCAILANVGKIIRERKEQLAEDLTCEQGKPLAESRGEVDDTADWFEWYAEEGKRVYGRVLPNIDPAKDLFVIKEPVGVVAVFSPWNFPISEPAAHMAAALAAGCTVIVKPSEETPGAASRMVQCCLDAGVPKDAINLVHGIPAEISEFLIAAGPVRKIAFTGSIPVGKHLAAMAASHMKKFTMELGGNAPMIVCDDVNAQAAAKLVAAKKFRNSGQVCTSPNRIFVQERVYDGFLSELTGIASALRVGDGLDKDTQMGPLVNARRVEMMESVISDATRRGASLRTGGARPNRKGFYWPPTVLSEVEDSARAMTEEVFGPVASVTRFKTIDEVIARANATPAGLASYVFTNSGEQARRLSRSIKTGMVGVNTTTVAFPEAPFGGVKESGLGKVGGLEGLEAYFNTKLVSTGLVDI